MPPTGETDPQARIGLSARAELAIGAGLGTAALLVPAGDALANDTSNAEVEKQALAAFGVNAVTRSIDSFPAPASTSSETLVPGPKGLVSAEASQATASDLQQDCVDAALDEPLNMWSTMIFPGGVNRNSRQQSVGAYLKFEPTSAECAPLVSRETPTARMKIQRPNNHKKFIRSKKKELRGGYEDGPDPGTLVPVPMDANTGRLGSASFDRYNGDSNKLRYRCTPGKGITKAWVTFTVRAASPVDGSTLGKRVLTQPIKIARTRPDLAHDWLPGPC
jgi:hypothetical protein